MCNERTNLFVPHFLIHCWLYYVADNPIVADATFDWLVGELERRWDDVEHPHKACLDRALLKTGFYLVYPSIVPFSAAALRQSFGS